MSFLKRGRSAVLAGLVLGGAVASQGCLQRDVKEDSPNTSNVFVEVIQNDKITAIDLLFVIDNSVSMGDKQAILQRAVPQMVGRLISPLCLDADGNPTGNSADFAGSCPMGQGAEFQPVNNIHIGVISSSIGGHGSNNCLLTGPERYEDDKAHLIATVRDVPPSSFDNTGFLAWNQDTAGNGSNADALVEAFAAHVGATGENGCGFEAPLEAWYRFLIDPDPYASIALDADARAVPAGSDDVVKAQRDAFLRPDGLVAIVMLTDENDCSAMDGGAPVYSNNSYGHLITTTRLPADNRDPYRMPISTEVCETNPNDKCCFSCLQWRDPPDGCEAAAGICNMGSPPKDALVDDYNVRCFENRRRFGVDLLYPTSRYVDALSKPELIDSRTGQPFANPLLRGWGGDAGKARPPGLVFLAGIVGVPWQDVATPASLEPGSVTMELLKASDLNTANVETAEGPINRWQVILGQPNLPANSSACNGSNEACGVAPVPPADPFMIESIEPRQVGLQNPISGDQIVAHTSNDPRANAINGHEADHTAVDPSVNVRDDLQYACIFPLDEDAVKVDCVAGEGSCDCGGEPSRNRPLCQPPQGGAAGTTQYFGKAYPGTRILQVLKDFGANSIVGSICPKNAIASAQMPVTDPNYGYNPAVQAIVDRLAEKLSGKCLPRELSVDENGEVPCTVVEAKPAPEPGEMGGLLNCSEAEGRAEVAPEVRRGILTQLELLERCGGRSLISCDTFQMCEIRELQGTPRDTCLYNPGQAESLTNPGFCYIDPAKVEYAAEDVEMNSPLYPAGGDPDGIPGTADDGTNPLVDNCPATQRRLLRFVGSNTPAPNTITFVACVGDAAGADQPIPEFPIPTEAEAM